MRGAPDWKTAVGGLHIPAHTREVEWLLFDARVYRRQRNALNSQRLFVTGDATASREYLAPSEVSAAATRLSPRCGTPYLVSAGDDYGVSSVLPQAPVYRVVCGETWYHVDGANGAVLEKLDSSRRAYRWLYSALHTFDFPALVARPALRTGLIVILCALGLAFSVTAVVIGWRRVMR